jgi:hypothetical protein
MLWFISHFIVGITSEGHQREEEGLFGAVDGTFAAEFTFISFRVGFDTGGGEFLAGGAPTQVRLNRVEVVGF